MLNATASCVHSMLLCENTKGYMWSTCGVDAVTHSPIAHTCEWQVELNGRGFSWQSSERLATYEHMVNTCANHTACPFLLVYTFMQQQQVNS